MVKQGIKTMDTATPTAEEQIDELIQMMAVSCPGGIYRLHPPVKALFLSILHIHIVECDEVAATFAKRYQETSSHKDDFQKRFYVNAGSYLRKIRPRLEGGYNRKQLAEIMLSLLEPVNEDDAHASTIHNRAVDTDRNGSVESRENVSGSNTSGREPRSKDRNDSDAGGGSSDSDYGSSSSSNGKSNGRKQKRSPKRKRVPAV